MSNKKISDLPDAGALQDTDQLEIARAGHPYSVLGDKFGGGGSLPDPSEIPTANATGVTIDTTTYDDPIAGGGAKLTTLVFPQNQGAIAIAIQGDDFPRWLMASNASDGLYIGDGTSDAYNDGVAITRTGSALLLEGHSANMQIGIADTNRTSVNQSGAPLALLGQANVALSSGQGAPVSGGNVGDLYIRRDPPDVNNYFYRCTTAGGNGVAVWEPLGGLT